MSYEKHKAGLAVDYMKLEQTPIEKAIWSVLDEYCDAENHPLKEYDLVCDVLQKVEEAVSKCTFTGWIPCSERLPEMDEYVLVSDVAGYVQVAGLYRDEDGDGELKWEDDKEGLDLYYEVVAWMPLPPAFVEGDRE